MKYFLAVLSFTFLVTSCKKDLEPQESSPVDSSAVAETQAVNPSTAVPMPQTMNPQMAMPQQPAAVKNSAGMNPAHGQPGHRCDIAVGAPLNSPVATKTATTTNTVTSAPQQTIKMPTQTTTPAKVAAGMNPAHGQPGHRCDIAVGQPLNSPVAAAIKSDNNTPALLQVEEPAKK